MESGIYLIINLLNGMIYVGSTYNFKNRWRNHIVELNLNRHCNPYLQSAWNKYGDYYFEFVIIEYVEDLGKLEEIEQLWINASNCCNREIGYNLCSIAGNKTGIKASAETSAKLSAIKKGKPRSEETKRKISESWKTRTVSEEAKRNMSLAHIGKQHSEETKKKMSASKVGNTINNGRKQTEEHIEKRRNSNLGQKRSDEAKVRMSLAKKGTVISEETKLKMSIAAKKRHVKKLDKDSNLWV